jgi:hypothetical protein
MLVLIGLRVSAVVSCQPDFHVWHQRVFHPDSGSAAEAAKTALIQKDGILCGNRAKALVVC